MSTHTGDGCDTRVPMRTEDGGAEGAPGAGTRVETTTLRSDGGDPVAWATFVAHCVWAFDYAHAHVCAPDGRGATTVVRSDKAFLTMLNGMVQTIVRDTPFHPMLSAGCDVVCDAPWDAGLGAARRRAIRVLLGTVPQSYDTVTFAGWLRIEACRDAQSIVIERHEAAPRVARHVRDIQPAEALLLLAGGARDKCHFLSS
jgi:hypothetical protein